ncbi:aspartate--ammonia ligase [[Mycoplasma] gypis]|uniref:Aspartate--ammonia ligase n=1 Tax=[Mycoplasma] gypis TaxID=92404 RepID=A0ABZ2RQK9_9BACT|nr:aspartate--ammonia ligase [[Mycoplasma] gypis]MBN0919338.1 aspartate--ammonia ligase [[Mycoplasma] gypis]
MKNKYINKLDLKQTQFAIEKLKEFFATELKRQLNLTRVSAPLFLTKESGLNDNLNGESAVSFMARGFDKELEVVHSLAKWKRFALKKYNFLPWEGIYTDMNAIRREEDLDNTHSFYVDQWDWELIIEKQDRTLDTLKQIVFKIYQVLKDTENDINNLYPQLSKKLVNNIHFISSYDLYQLYPNLTANERENEIAKKYKSVFIYQIGDILPDQKPHSARAKDYDDWNLNGDLIVWDEINQHALELSSMGIRVDRDALIRQYNLKPEEIQKNSPFHKQLIDNELPFTIGGGIGQSRISMFLLEKRHIGEVQVSVWDENNSKMAQDENFTLL